MCAIYQQCHALVLSFVSASYLTLSVSMFSIWALYFPAPPLPSQVWFLGHSLTDHTRTIIHHYTDHEGKDAIRYPNFPSGWTLSATALRRWVVVYVPLTWKFEMHTYFMVTCSHALIVGMWLHFKFSCSHNSNYLNMATFQIFRSCTQCTSILHVWFCV